MRNPLQEQLLKAGLVKKGKVAQVVREQTRQRHGKAPPAPDPQQVDVRRLQAERAERDRALAAERNAALHAQERRAQVRQLVATQQVPRTGEIPYRFQDGGAIRSLLVDAAQRRLLASGELVVVRHEGGHALVTRATADKVRARDPGSIVLDHGSGGAVGAGVDTRADADADADAEYYARFKVPDDLTW